MNKLFDIIVIGAGAKGKRIASKLAKKYDVVVIDPEITTIKNVTCVNNSVIYLTYIRGILGAVLKGASSPEIFGKRLIIATPDVEYLPKNFYELDPANNKVIINENGQLPALKPLVYVANKIADGFTMKTEAAITMTVEEGL